MSVEETNTEPLPIRFESVRLHTVTVETAAAEPKSTCHHGWVERLVWVTEPFANTPLVLPSTARAATAVPLVLDWVAVLPRARFGAETVTVVVVAGLLALPSRTTRLKVSLVAVAGAVKVGFAAVVLDSVTAGPPVWVQV